LKVDIFEGTKNIFNAVLNLVFLILHEENTIFDLK